MNGIVPPPSRLRLAQEEDFVRIAADAQAGLTDAIDLILIHNERAVRGKQPRAALNPLILMLSVAAWERFIADLSLLSLATFDRPGFGQSARGGAYFRSNSAPWVLKLLSAERLPGEFAVKVFDTWRGKSPRAARIIQGIDIAEYINDAITHRNAVAHRSLPGSYIGAMFTSDAIAHTIQAGWARGVTATFVQLLDQSILTIARESGFSSVPRFPSDWFVPEPKRLRGVASPGPLWGGHGLVRAG